MTPMKVCIYGAGAVGSWLAVQLPQGGMDVSLVARSGRVERLRERGIFLHAEMVDEDGVKYLARSHNLPNVTDQPAELGPQDLVILAVKTPALPAVLPQLAPLLGPDTMVMTLANGVPWWFLNGFGGACANHRLASVDPDGALAAALAPERIVGGVVHASCSLHLTTEERRHDMVKRTGAANKIIVGEPSGAMSERVALIRDYLLSAEIESEQSDCIQRDIWYKLWGNLTLNPISALTGALSDQILGDGLLLDLTTRIMLEARAVGEKLGIVIDEQPADRIEVARQLGAFKTSMLQDVEAGKPLELDAIIGAVHELGRLTGTDTPHTDALFGLARLQARQRGLYPAT